MNDRRVLGLLYALVTLSVLNFGTTLYFQFETIWWFFRSAVASHLFKWQRRRPRMAGIVDLYNDNKFHELISD